MKAEIFLNEDGNNSGSIFLCDIDIDFTPFEGLNFWILSDCVSNSVTKTINEYLKTNLDEEDTIGLHIDMISYAIKKTGTVMILWVTNIS